MSNPIVPGSSADVNVQVRALGADPNVSVQYKTIILKKNLVNGVNTLTQEMLTQSNTKYVIKYDYDLADEIIQIPANCILLFDGGSITNGYVNCNQAEVLGYNYINCPLFNKKQKNRLIKSKILRSIWWESTPRTLAECKTLLLDACIHGYDGFSFCPTLLSNSSTDVIVDVINFSKLIGFECLNLKPHYSVTNDLQGITEACTIAKNLAYRVKQECGITEYFSLLGERNVVNETTEGSDIYNVVKDACDYIKGLGYKVLIFPDGPHLLDMAHIDDLYNVSALGVDLYHPVGGVYGARTTQDVKDYLALHLVTIKDQMSIAGKPYVIPETGIGPFEECFYAPGRWDFWGWHRNNDVPYIYWKGIFESELCELAEFIASWYDSPVHGWTDKMYSLFRKYTGNY